MLARDDMEDKEEGRGPRVRERRGRRDGRATNLRRMDATKVRIGLLGCGTVGSALAELLAEEAATIERRTGLRLEVTRVVVRDLTRNRGVALPASMFTTDAAEVVTDPEIDLVVGDGRRRPGP